MYLSSKFSKRCFLNAGANENFVRKYKESVIKVTTAEPSYTSCAASLLIKFLIINIINILNLSSNYVTYTRMTILFFYLELLNTYNSV